MTGWVLHLISKRSSRRERLLATVMLHAARAQASHSIAFRGHSASTLATPIGTYAGKTPVLDPLRLAERQFHAMQLSQDVTIN